MPRRMQTSHPIQSPIPFFFFCSFVMVRCHVTLPLLRHTRQRHGQVFTLLLRGCRWLFHRHANFMVMISERHMFIGTCYFDTIFATLPQQFAEAPFSRHAESPVRAPARDEVMPRVCLTPACFNECHAYAAYVCCHHHVTLSSQLPVLVTE